MSPKVIDMGYSFGRFHDPGSWGNAAALREFALRKMAVKLNIPKKMLHADGNNYASARVDAEQFAKKLPARRMSLE